MLAEFEARKNKVAVKQMEKFDGKPVLYVRPEEYSLHGNAVELVEDVESLSGSAVKVDSKASHYYSLPYEMGCYDLVGGRNIASRRLNDVFDRTGYSWYSMGHVTIKENCELYFSRAWTTKLQISFPETIGKTFEVWASLKFAGPMYHPNQNGDSNVFLGLVVLEEIH